MDYEKAYAQLDEILSATNHANDRKLDTVFVNGQRFATTVYGEALLSVLKEEISCEMEDFGLSAQEATDKIVDKIKGLDSSELQWWKQNGWLREVFSKRASQAEGLDTKGHLNTFNFKDC